MDNKGGERIGLLFLHDAGSSGADIASFFSSIPLESFGDKSFQEVCEMLRIQVVTPTALVRSDTDANEEMEVESSLFWEWFAVSPDWRVLGLENTLQEDRHSIDLSKQQVKLFYSLVEILWHVFCSSLTLMLFLYLYICALPTVAQGIIGPRAKMRLYFHGGSCSWWKHVS